MKLIKTLAIVIALAIGVTAGASAKTIRWGAARDIASLDPYSFGDTFTLAVLNHVYEGLVRYDQHLKIEPALATSWSTVSPTAWRFKLRQGVKFHNGSAFTADDVLASLERVSHPNSPLKGICPRTNRRRRLMTTRSISRSTRPTRCCSTI